LTELKSSSLHVLTMTKKMLS